VNGIRVVHLAGLTKVTTANGALLGLVVGSGAMSLAYSMPDLRLLGTFDGVDAAVAEIADAVAEAQRAK